jgi:hypothetical protein
VLERDLLQNELMGIYNASVSLVKRLRRRGAHVLAGQFTEIAMQSSKLRDRRDLLLPTYRRSVARIRKHFESAVVLSNDQFPSIFVLDAQPNYVTEKEITKTIKVSITLPIAEWDLIDHLISHGSVQTMSEYFRKLHIEKR